MKSLYMVVVLVLLACLSACLPEEGSIVEESHSPELCSAIGEAYAGCIVEYCGEVAPTYDWDVFFDALSQKINDRCLESTTGKMYSKKFLECFSKYSCKEILVYDACGVGAPQNYCGVTKLN